MSASEWGSDVEVERRNRIRLSVAAWAYERHADSFLSDAEYDALALTIRPEMRTGSRKLDNFFRKHFSPDTGQWVHRHPDRARLEHFWQTLYRPRVAPLLR